MARRSRTIGITTDHMAVLKSLSIQENQEFRTSGATHGAGTVKGFWKELHLAEARRLLKTFY